MGIGVLEHRIEFFQLDPGILCCESPPHSRLRPIAMALPSSDFVPQHRHFVDPTVEALPRKNTQFGLRHIQPTAMLGRIVDLQSLPQSPRLHGGKGFVQCPTGVRIQIVTNQHQTLHLRIAPIFAAPVTCLIDTQLTRRFRPGWLRSHWSRSRRVGAQAIKGRQLAPTGPLATVRAASALSAPPLSARGCGPVCSDGR